MFSVATLEFRDKKMLVRNLLQLYIFEKSYQRGKKSCFRNSLLPEFSVVSLCIESRDFSELFK